MKSLSFVAAILLLTSCSKKDVLEDSVSFSQESSSLLDLPPTHKWFNIVEGFKSEDLVHHFSPNTIVDFIGSSSIYLWPEEDIKASFPTIQFIKRALPGAILQDVFYSEYDLVAKYSPKTIVIYIGDNDVSLGYSVSAMISGYTRLIDKIRADNPNALLLIMSCKPSVTLWATHEQVIRELNEGLKILANRPNTQYINIFDAMLLNGAPNPALYKDGLHLTAAGYTIWANALKPFLAPVTAPPPPAPTDAPIANAGPDQTLRASTRYCKINAARSKAAAGRWITSITWEQLSGDTKFNYTPVNKGDTNLQYDGAWSKGTYTFRCKVTDNKGVSSFDETIIILN